METLRKIRCIAMYAILKRVIKYKNKNMKAKLVIAIILSLLYHIHPVESQPALDSILLRTEFFNIEEALKNPEKVIRLDLSNQNHDIPDEVWGKFVNLEFLSFKNDHLKVIPKEIGRLKKLKMLDLSGNDFKVLPKSFSGLTNLEELYLNDETNFNLTKSMEVIGLLPKLKILHLENDRLNKLPKNIVKLSHLESLYLNSNDFREVPMEIKGLNQLKFLDLKDNKIKLDLQDMSISNFGYQIRF